MKTAVMHQKKPGQAAFIFFGDGGIIQCHTARIIVFDGEQVGKIKKANYYTLKPVNPYNSGQSVRMILIIPDAIQISRNQQHKRRAGNNFFKHGRRVSYLYKQT